MTEVEAVIIGAGIAGASLASELAPHMRVLIAEREEFPGYHSTGRSAAFWTESYGGPAIQPLTSASGPFYANPPREIASASLLVPRGALTIGTDSDIQVLRQFEDTFAGAGVSMEKLNRSALAWRIPGLREAYRHGVLEPDCCDINVNGVHQGYLGHALRSGAKLRTCTELIRADYRRGAWRLQLGGETVRAGLMINAAGAWADSVAALASVQPLSIIPYRRTVLQLATDPAAPADLPLVLDINENFYFKPDAGRLWLSPHDETPVPPGDVAPEELDIALAIERFEQVVDWKVLRLERSWAGLRSFAPDRLPVYGFDPATKGFFWFAGQGGFGIQTAPAAAKLAAALILGTAPDAMVARIDPATYAPDRFAAKP